MNDRHLLFLLAVLAALIAAGLFVFMRGSEDWSSIDRDAFRRACLETSGGEGAYCDCALAITEDSYDDLDAASADFSQRPLAEIEAAQRTQAECLPLAEDRGPAQ